MSSDTFAIVGVSRWGGGLAVRFSRIYVPEGGRALDFDAIERDIRDVVRRYAVRELTYDRFLLGQTMRRFQEKPLPVPLEPFNQGGDRLEADKALRDWITTRRLAHDGTHADLRSHLDNANARMSADGRQLRIVKRSQAKKIDGAVALGMACARAAEVLPLIIDGPLAY
jgi:phage terminase large subunit-like protein